MGMAAVKLILAAGNDTVQVGIATFDTTVHFYTLQGSQSQAQMLVMPDVEDVYSVSSASVVVPLQPSFDLVSCLFAARSAPDKLTPQAPYTLPKRHHVLFSFTVHI